VILGGGGLVWDLQRGGGGRCWSPAVGGLVEGCGQIFDQGVE